MNGPRQQDRERIAAIQATLDTFRPGRFATTRYVRLYNIASNLAAALAYEQGVIGPRCVLPPSTETPQ